MKENARALLGSTGEEMENMTMNRYIRAFLAGGTVGVVSHFITQLYRRIGIDELIVVSVTVVTLAAAGAVLTVTGHYQKFTRAGGMGAILAMSGFSSAITDGVYESRKRGSKTGKAIWEGVKEGILILFCGYLASAAMAAVTYLAQRA